MTSALSLRKALDRLTLYLPILFMALLAMGSWWLVRSMPDVWGDLVDKPVRKDPDYHLGHFVTRVFDAQGQQVRQFSGANARHYPETDELHIETVRFQGVTDKGVDVQGSARQAIALSDAQRLTLIGQAQVVRQPDGLTPRIELRGPRLLVLQKEEKLISSEPVEILRGADRFTAQGAVLDTGTGQYQLSGRVRGVLAPRQP